jgi:hypothetical protein
LGKGLRNAVEIHMRAGRCSHPLPEKGVALETFTIFPKKFSPGARTELEVSLAKPFWAQYRQSEL